MEKLEYIFSLVGTVLSFGAVDFSCEAHESVEGQKYHGRSGKAC